MFDRISVPILDRKTYDHLALMIDEMDSSIDVHASSILIRSRCFIDPISTHIDRFNRSMETIQRPNPSICCCGKLVSFMWKNCRKDVALTFDFYTNSRSGCCSFEEID